MAKQIYQLPSKVTASNDDEVAIQETSGGTTKKVRVEDLAFGIPHQDLNGAGSQTHAQIDAFIAGAASSYLGQVSNSTDNRLIKTVGTTGVDMEITTVSVDDNDRLYGHGMVIEEYAAASIELGSPEAGKVIRFTAGVPIAVQLPNPVTNPQRAGYQVGLIQGTDNGQLQITCQGSDTLISHTGSPTGYNFAGGKGSCVLITQVDGSPPFSWVLMGDYGGMADPAIPTLFTKQWNFQTWQLTDGSPGSPSVYWDLNEGQVALLITGSPLASRQIQNPQNMIDGGHYTLIIQQGSPGGHNVTFDTAFDFGEYGSPSIANNTWGDKTILTFISDGSSMYCGMGLEPDRVTALTGQHYFEQQTLSDGSPSISWNLTTQQVAKVVLDGGYGTRTMAAPTNMKAGGTYILTIEQGGAGTQLINWNSAYNFGDNGSPTLSTAVGAKDIISFISDGTEMFASTLTGF